MDRRLEQFWERVTERFSYHGETLPARTRVDVVEIGFESPYNGATVHAVADGTVLTVRTPVARTQLDALDNLYSHFALNSGERERALSQGDTDKVAAEDARLAQRFMRDRVNLLKAANFNPDRIPSLRKVILSIEK